MDLLPSASLRMGQGAALASRSEPRPWQSWRLSQPCVSSESKTPTVGPLPWWRRGRTWRPDTPSTCPRGDAPCRRVGRHLSPPGWSPWTDPCQPQRFRALSPALASTGSVQARDGAGCQGALCRSRHQSCWMWGDVEGRASWGCISGARVAPHVEGATRAGTGHLSG